jgi:hypothetical protein
MVSICGCQALELRRTSSIRYSNNRKVRRGTSSHQNALVLAVIALIAFASIEALILFNATTDPQTVTQTVVSTTTKGTVTTLTYTTTINSNHVMITTVVTTTTMFATTTHSTTRTITTTRTTTTK